MAETTSRDSNTTQDLDVLIVGAGFAGLYQLHHFRKLGYRVKVFEAGSGIGGTWYWNRYPGARVDSDALIYQYGMEELWKGWNFTERFPGGPEILDYFRYVDDKLDLSRDIQFNSTVVSAHFDTNSDHWKVTTQDGNTTRCRFLSLCIGFSAKPYSPPFDGIDTFAGTLLHTSRWPKEHVDLKGKRIGVIGTGATGVQVIQETGPHAAHLTVFQRTPNLALPMRQQKIAENHYAAELPSVFLTRAKMFGGFHFGYLNRRVLETPPEELGAEFQRLWDKGGLNFWLGSFQDVLMDQVANDKAYAFWREKVRERLVDDRMKEKLAPTVPPHPFGTKRASLEQNFYEVFNQPNVSLVDLKDTPIVKITPAGVLTSDGKEHELDVLILATGFDAVSGSFTQIDLRGTDGVSLKDKWSNGLSSYLGHATANFPNMFWVYGPHGPTAFCNGPTCIEMQSNWVIDCIDYMRANGLTRIEATKEAELGWTKLVHQAAETGLVHTTRSWYTGANIPGKRVEPLNWAGGVPMYQQLCREKAEAGYEGFRLSRTITEASG